MTSTGHVRGCNVFAAQDLVHIEGNPLAVADGIHHHQLAAAAQLHDVAGREKVSVAQTSEAVGLDGAALVLELGGQPRQRGMLSRRR